MSVLEYARWKEAVKNGSYDLKAMAVVALFPPGEYLLRKASDEDLADAFADEDEGRTAIIHDYLLAKLRRDGAMQERLRRGAVRYCEKYAPDEVEIGHRTFEKLDADTVKHAKELPKSLFLAYRQRLAVPNWRMSEDEKVVQGRERGLPFEDTEARRAYIEEARRWDVEGLTGVLLELYEEARKERQDRLICWIIKGLLKWVHDEVYGGLETTGFPYIDGDWWPDGAPEEAVGRAVGGPPAVV